MSSFICWSLSLSDIASVGTERLLLAASPPVELELVLEVDEPEEPSRDGRLDADVAVGPVLVASGELRTTTTDEPAVRPPDNELVLLFLLSELLPS